MWAVHCPNSVCDTTFFAEAFRPVQFECPECGLACEWFAENRHGFLRWSVTEAAIDYVVTEALLNQDMPDASDIGDDLMDIGGDMMGFGHMLDVEGKAEAKLLREVAGAKHVDPHDDN